MIASARDGSFLTEVKDGVLRLSFNRPQHGNSTPAATVPELVDSLRAARSDPSVRCLLIRGEGKVFASGADVGSLSQSIEQQPVNRQADFARRLANARMLVEALAAIEVPVIVSMRGAAAGAGLMYPLIADYVIADDTATFLFAHRRVALSPDAGVTALLPQVVGMRMARMLLITAARVDAAEALRLNMVHRIVPAKALEDEAMALARQLARAPQTAVRLAKKLVGDSITRGLGETLEAEGEAIVACVGDDDFVEGVRALLEKRSPVFPSTLCRWP